MDRRRFLRAAAALPFAGCQQHRSDGERAVTVHRPGMREGHLLRDATALPPPSGEIRCAVAILGSGVAGISAAWKLWREGVRDFVLLAGPEPFGNAAGMQLGGVSCPTGAHYLPLPTMESTHVREMLADIGVIESGTFALRPRYAETALLHPLQERLLIGSTWHDELLPASGMEASERDRFLAQTETLRRTFGNDGKRVFAMPIALCSQDPAWRWLDTLNFRDWLTREGYRSPLLHWYADYACRDDYGAGYERVSAWAGLHYFACRNGEAENAEPGTLLTWPDGLHAPLARLMSRIPFDTRPGGPRLVQGFATRVQDRRDGASVLASRPGPSGAQRFMVRAERVICAMPLHVARHVVPGMHDTLAEMAAERAPWLVANFLLRRFPVEHGDHAVAWDNVLRESRALGYVVATHQLIRAARPARTVFTAYRALCDGAPTELRNWLQHAPDSAMLALAEEDLVKVYGDAFRPLVEEVHISLRGHAMPVPAPGFLARAPWRVLDREDGRVLFAHADMSGYSVFEEAAWWGYRAATRVL